MSKMTKHEELVTMLARADVKVTSIFKQLTKIDKRLENLNGKVATHEKDLVVVKTWGAVALLLAPIIINIVMDLMK